MPVFDVSSAADALLEAERSRTARGRLTAEWPGLDLASGYAVQREVVRRRLDAGDRVAGLKLGLTSLAKQRQVGVDAPITGVLLERHRLAPGAALRADELIHPRVEAELAVVLGAEFGAGATPDAVRRAIVAVMPAFEVIDSRFVDFDFAIADVAADDASSARFVLGPATAGPVDLVAEGVRVLRGGETVAAASGEAIMGDPAVALAAAARDLAARGEVLPAGVPILAGAPAGATPASPGDVFVAEYSTLGRIRLAVA